MTENNYKILLEKVRTGEVRIIGVLSPPRVVSTAFEILLTESPDINGQINEPFHLSLSDKFNNHMSTEDRAYGDVLRRVKEIQGQTGAERVTLVMKEMAKNLAPGAQLARWQNVTSEQIVLVRNPLSNISSLLRKLSSVAEDREDLVGFNLNEHALQRGYQSDLGQHWQMMLEETMVHQNYRLLSSVFESFFPQSNLYRFEPHMMEAYLEVADNRVAFRAGFQSLDHFAVQAGFSSWAHMRTEMTDMDKYKPILDEMFKFRNAGWESIEEHMRELKRPIIIDVSALRSRPEPILRSITKRLGVRYDGRMVNGWSKHNGNNFDQGHKRTGASVFIDTARQSRRLNLPREKPVAIKQFPEGFQSYILEVAIPIYLRILLHDNTLGNETVQDLEAILNTKVLQDTPLKARDPVFAYALVVTNKEISSVDKQRLLGEIRKTSDMEYGDVFNVIDEATQIQNKSDQIQHEQPSSVNFSVG